MEEEDRDGGEGNGELRPIPAVEEEDSVVTLYGVSEEEIPDVLLLLGETEPRGNPSCAKGPPFFPHNQEV